MSSIRLKSPNLGEMYMGKILRTKPCVLFFRRTTFKYLLFGILLTVFLLTVTNGCTPSSTSVGGFRIAQSSSYEVKESNSLRQNQTSDGYVFEICDSVVMLNDSNYGVGAIWCDGISFEDAKIYLENHIPGEDKTAEERFSMPSQEWRTVNECDVIFSNRIPGFITETETVAELGTPYSCYTKTLIFPTSENSIGAFTLVAHSSDQKNAEEALFDELLDNVLIG